MDPLFDEPWSHAAEELYLRNLVSRSEYGDASHEAGQLAVWHYKDALRKHDLAGASRALADVHDYVEARLAESDWYTPGSCLMHTVFLALDHGAIDQAADELKYWQPLVGVENLPDDRRQTTNARHLIHCQCKFLSHPQGSRHAAASPIRDQARTLYLSAEPILRGDDLASLARIGITA